MKLVITGAAGFHRVGSVSMSTQSSVMDSGLFPRRASSWATASSTDAVRLLELQAP